MLSAAPARARDAWSSHSMCAKTRSLSAFSTRLSLSSPSTKNILFIFQLFMIVDCHFASMKSDVRAVTILGGGLAMDANGGARRAPAVADIRSCGPDLPVLRPSSRIATSARRENAKRCPGAARWSCDRSRHAPPRRSIQYAAADVRLDMPPAFTGSPACAGR